MRLKKILSLILAIGNLVMVSTCLTSKAVNPVINYNKVFNNVFIKKGLTPIRGVGDDGARLIYLNRIIETMKNKYDTTEYNDFIDYFFCELNAQYGNNVNFEDEIGFLEEEYRIKKIKFLEYAEQYCNSLLQQIQEKVNRDPCSQCVRSIMNLIKQGYISIFI